MSDKGKEVKSALSAKGVKTAAKGIGRLLATSHGRSITESMVVQRNCLAAFCSRATLRSGLLGLVGLLLGLVGVHSTGPSSSMAP